MDQVLKEVKELVHWLSGGRAFQIVGILSYKGLEVKQCLTLFRNIKETNVFGRDQGRE